MNKLKCNIPEHDQSKVNFFCYSQNCQMSSRRLCNQCVCEHFGHKVTILNPNPTNCAIMNLRTNYRQSLDNSTQKNNINQYLSTLLQKCTQMFQKVDKFKQNCYLNNLSLLAQDINYSFKENGHIIGITKILDQNTSNSQLNTIAKSIRCFEREHLKNINLLQQCCRCMQNQLSKVMDKCFTNINKSLDQVQFAAKYWSVFQVEDYKERLIEFDRKNPIENSDQSQIYSLDSQSNITSSYQSQEQSQTIEEYLINFANQKGWYPIQKWIQTGKQLINMQQLSLIGKNNNIYHYPSTIRQSITQIKAIDALYNLKSLQLISNEIVKIQNINILTKLQILNLNLNKITKITGIQKLINLKQLHLRGNQISKIQNLSTLLSLQWLDLEFNPLYNSKRNQEQAKALKKRIENCFINI